MPKTQSKNQIKNNRKRNYFKHLSEEISFRLDKNLLNKLDASRGKISRGKISKIVMTNYILGKTHQLDPSSTQKIVKILLKILNTQSKLERQISRSHIPDNLDQIAHVLNASRLYNQAIDRKKVKKKLEDQCNFKDFQKYSNQLSQIDNEVTKLWQQLQ